MITEEELHKSNGFGLSAAGCGNWCQRENERTSYTTIVPESKDISEGSSSSRMGIFNM